MKIFDVKGGNWPIDTVCTGCHFGLKLDEPKDLFKEVSYYYEFLDSAEGEPILHYYYTCPLCGEKMEMPESRIPEPIRKHIPAKFL